MKQSNQYPPSCQELIPAPVRFLSHRNDLCGLKAAFFPSRFFIPALEMQRICTFEQPK
ncbi:MAG: hypothetical protein ACK5SQ_13060 [Chitinophagales bacterium]|jgi:hypothetical protein